MAVGCYSLSSGYTISGSKRLISIISTKFRYLALSSVTHGWKSVASKCTVLYCKTLVQLQNAVNATVAPHSECVTCYFMHESATGANKET